MSDVFNFSQGELPLLISMPHDGRDIPEQISARMTAAGRAIPDTDWHVRALYDFAAEFGASMLAANYSRYVVDLNRSSDDGVLYPGQTVTGLCPEKTFSGDAIYETGGASATEIQERVEAYWRPYHDWLGDTLESLCAVHGYALLWDAHSIPSRVPRLFDGELPALNLGSNSGKSCGAEIEHAVARVAQSSSYSIAVNGRFKGGYITRNYGDPTRNVHALQMEIAQRVYMDEKTTTLDESMAELLRDTLRSMLQSFLDAAKQ